MTFPDLGALKDFAGWKAARAPRTVGPTPDSEGLRAAYLGLLKLALCDLATPTTGSVSQMLDGSVASRELRGDDRRVRSAGLDWPLHGLTMIGLNRLDDLQACVETVVRDGVDGDLIEAGAWRGGASILMRATLDSLGASERTVHVADSFQGFPPTPQFDHPDAAAFFAVSVDEVRDSFARFGLERGVRMVPGFFEETMPGLAAERWALVRLDGDSYAATSAALDALYPGLTVGGYLIVDDYGVMPDECRRAVDDFRARNDISEPLEEVDWTCVRWQRADDAPIEPAPGPPVAPERAEAVPRSRTARVPTGRELELEREVAALREQLSARRWPRRVR